jgi:hypothetical protein
MRRLASRGVFAFSFIGVFLLLLLLLSLNSSRASIRTRSEPLWARCLLGPDGDELGRHLKDGL